ncbi:hypothetical protein RIF29_06493 [Crotalaria pallida]|uniref:Serine-threonine/tyrosine-protein kinase catalytic domain-containing protein n=1 Tax=Crotalaria pallida TaxID=3830 RepID=A0AAN9J4B9_CROPI
MVSRLKHDNFVQLLGYCVDISSRILAYEFASNGSLHDILNGIYMVRNRGPLEAHQQRRRRMVAAVSNSEGTSQSRRSSRSLSPLAIIKRGGRIGTSKTTSFSSFGDTLLPPSLIQEHMQEHP